MSMINLLKELPPVYSNKLDDQIKWMENTNKIFLTPMGVSILNSLKELKGIKENRVNLLKSKSKA